MTGLGLHDFNSTKTGEEPKRVSVKVFEEGGGVKKLLTGKQRSYLRALANRIEVVLQIGKSGTNKSVLKQADEALEARELVKIRILKNALLDAETAANGLAGKLKAEIVQIIGNNFVLYRPSRKKPKIKLP